MKDFMEDPEEKEEKKTENEPVTIPELPPLDREEVKSAVLPVIISEVVLTAVMLLVYAVIGRWSVKVLSGALLGMAAIILNFLVMVSNVLKAEKHETSAKGALAVRGNYTLRMIAMLVLLALAISTGYFDVIAVVLPLCFMRISLFMSQMILKKWKKGDKI